MARTSGQSASAWRAGSVDELAASLSRLRGGHVVLFLGSPISFGRPTACLGVPEIEDLLVLGPMIAGARSAATDLGSLIAAELEAVRDSKAHKSIPFEAFMGCLSAADPELATTIVQIAVDSDASVSNPNHDAAVALAFALIEKGHAAVVSLVTTNYDLGLDSALARGLRREGVSLRTIAVAGFDASSAAWRAGRINYLKIHGCVNRPTSLVFTIEQMSRLLFTDWSGELARFLAPSQGERTVLVFAGYGFWDPDIRDFISTLSEDAEVWRTVLGGAQEAPPITGPEYLRRDFFRRLADESGATLRQLRTNLVRGLNGPTSRNVLGELCALFGAPSFESPLPPAAGDRVVDAAISAVSSRAATIGPVFLGNLLHALNMAPASPEVLRIALERDTDSSRRLQLAFAHFRALGARNAWDSGLDEARRLTASPDVDVALVAHAFGSFDATMMGRIREGYAMLRSGARLRRRAKEVSALAFDDHRLHFWCKVPEGLVQRFAGRPLGQVAAWVAAAMARRQLRRLQTHLHRCAELHAVESYGGACQLIAEMSILAKRDDAEQAVERVKHFRALIGRASESIQVDRTVGWCEARHGDRAGRIRALGAFARGLRRTVELADVGDVRRSERAVERRFAANLMRIAHGLGYVDIREGEVREHSFDGVAQASHTIEIWAEAAACNTGSTLTSVVSDALLRLSEQTRWLFSGREADLAREIVRLIDTRRFPIYLPTCEPSKSTSRSSM